MVRLDRPDISAGISASLRQDSRTARQPPKAARLSDFQFPQLKHTSFTSLRPAKKSSIFFSVVSAMLRMASRVKKPWCEVIITLLNVSSRASTSSASTLSEILEEELALLLVNIKPCRPYLPALEPLNQIGCPYQLAATGVDKHHPLLHHPDGF